MKEVTTKYYCDRCGAEVHPYGRHHEISSGYGCVIATTGYFDPDKIVKRIYVGQHSESPGSYDYSMALCEECFNGLGAYLRNE